MLIFRLWYSLRGCVVLRLEGPAPEKLINLASQRGIRLWRVHKVDPGGLYVFTTPVGFRALRPLARRTGCHVELVRREGLPFLFQRLARRKLLALGGVLFLAALYFLSSFVWLIRVEGSESVPRQKILEVAARAGLKVGAPKWRLEAARIERALLAEIEELSWAGVVLQGAVARVRVVEKKLPPEEGAAPAHLVARRAGLLTAVIPWRGIPLVREGDTVQEGQILISGIVPVAGEAAGERFAYLRAGGVVRARVWYEGTAEVPWEESVRVRTGRVARSYGLSVWRMTVWFGARRDPFLAGEKEEAVHRLYFDRKIPLPVELKTVTHYELQQRRIVHTASAARALAVERARAEARKGMGRGAEVRAEQVEVSESPGRTAARVILEVEEEIQAVRPLSVEEPPPPPLRGGGEGKQDGGLE